MNVVAGDVKDLVRKEHRSATETWGPLSSLPEGYAVLLEEVEETSEALERVQRTLQQLWGNIRRGGTIRSVKICAEAVKADAEQTACEAIQVAAVCLRIMELLEGM